MHLMSELLAFSTHSTLVGHNLQLRFLQIKSDHLQLLGSWLCKLGLDLKKVKISV